MSPKPIKNWPQCGVSSKILHVRHDRDCKDWVGEDTPFFLSLFRHTADQEPLGEGDGPITIMMTPNRGSFAYRSGRKFVKVIDAQFVCTDRHLREDHRAEEGGLGHRLHADGDVLRHLPQADGGPDQEDTDIHIMLVNGEYWRHGWQGEHDVTLRTKRIGDPIVKTIMRKLPRVCLRRQS